MAEAMKDLRTTFVCLTRRIFDNNGRLAGSAGTITATSTPSRQIGRFSSG
jgi:hypothetical protein